MQDNMFHFKQEKNMHKNTETVQMKIVNIVIHQDNKFLWTNHNGKKFGRPLKTVQVLILKKTKTTNIIP